MRRLALVGVLLASCGTPAQVGAQPDGFVWIAPGTYERSLDADLSASNVNDDGPGYGDEVEAWARDHEAAVTVPYGFYMSTTHVTVGQFRRFVRDTGYVTTVLRDRTGYIVDGEGNWTQGAVNDWRQTFWDLERDQPVVQVSWFDAMAYADWLSARIGMEVRLPTLEEWELAVGGRAWPWGDFDPERANCADRSFVPFEWRHRFSDGYRYVNGVHDLPPTDGLYDVIGNVWSWVHTPAVEREASRGSYQASPPDSVPDPETEMAMVGGAFASRVAHCNALAPMTHPARDGSFDVGFRLVAVP